MSKYSFTFRSVTQAQYALVVLNRYGIDGELVQAPMEVSENGCAYAVQVRIIDGYRAALLLRQEGVLFVRVYQTTDRGSEVLVP